MEALTQTEDKYYGKKVWKAMRSWSWRKALQICKLDTTEGIAFVIITQIVIGVALFLVTGWQGFPANFATRCFTALTPFVLLPGVFFYQLTKAPAQLLREAYQQIRKIEAQLNDRIAEAQPYTEHEFFTEADSTLIPLSSNRFTVLFKGHMRALPTILGHEPPAKEWVIERMERGGFTVVFPSLKTVDRLRFRAEAFR